MTHLKLLPLILVLITSSGCASLGRDPVKLYPIEKSDIVSMPKGVAYTPEKDGWFLSDLYMEEVQRAKVDRLKRVS